MPSHLVCSFLADGNTTVIGVVIAAIVPFVSVYFAQHLSREQRKRELALEQFLGIKEDFLMLEVALANLLTHRNDLPYVAQKKDEQVQDELYIKSFFEAVERGRASTLGTELLFGEKAAELNKALLDFANQAQQYVIQSQDTPTPPGAARTEMKS